MLSTMLTGRKETGEQAVDGTHDCAFIHVLGTLWQEPRARARACAPDAALVFEVAAAARSEQWGGRRERFDEGRAGDVVG